MDIVFRRTKGSPDLVFVEIEQCGYSIRAGTEVERWGGTVAIRLGLRSVVSAWFAGRKVRRAKRRDHRAMGRCPDCGTYMAAHRLFGHGVSRRP
jgi:hypothetical protein